MNQNPSVFIYILALIDLHRWWSVVCFYLPLLSPLLLLLSHRISLRLSRSRISLLHLNELLISKAKRRASSQPPASCSHSHIQVWQSLFLSSALKPPRTSRSVFLKIFWRIIMKHRQPVHNLYMWFNSQCSSLQHCCINGCLLKGQFTQIQICPESE